MIKYKKLGLGLSILFAVVAFFGFNPPKASAYVNGRSDIQQCLSSLKFTDIAHITCDAGSSGKITFVDNHPDDPNHNYVPVDSSMFCTIPTHSIGFSQAPDYSVSPNDSFGITLNGVKSTLNVYVSQNKLSSVDATAYLTYTSGTKCYPYGTPESPSVGDTVKLPTPKVGAADQTSKLLAWSDANTIGSLSGVTKGQLSGKSYTRVPGEDPGNGSKNILYQSGDFDASSCSGSVLVTTTDGTSARILSISSSSSGGKLDGALTRLLTGDSCDSTNYTLANVINFDLLGPVPSGLAVNTSGKAGQPTAPVGGAGTTQPTACEANSAGSVFTWLLCPMLDAASKMTTELYDLFTNQLSFRVGNLGQVSDPASGAAHVQLTWTVVKDLASAILIIIGLIMVIGQAIERGPFDAYTVKKILPRIVVAAIVIQLSWALMSWFVGIVDDIGKGLSGIMYLAFGGEKSMNLFALLGNAGFTDSAGGVFKLATFDWALIGGTIVAAVVFPFMMLGVATVAVFGLLAALLTLVFRKILIIMALILAPIAILAWILPGTQKFWKLWQDNFTKALMMYPIAVAIIASGRIFAWVAGTQKNGTLISLLFVIIGFFGPLFILPKTFKWGGSVMSMAGNSIMKAGTKMSERPKKFFDTRQEGWSAERQRQSQERYTKGIGFNWKRPWRRPIDLVRSGQVDPTLWGRRRQQAMTRYAAKGHESEQQDIKEADARAQILFSQVDDHDALARAMAEGQEGARYETHEDRAYNDANGLVGPARRAHTLGHVSHAERIAGLSAVAKYGGDRNFRFLDRVVSELRGGSDEDRAMAKTFLDANAQSLLPKMKHLYYGANRDSAISSMIGSVSENSFVGMEGAEAQAIIESVTQRMDAGDPTAGADLSRLLTFYETAINDTNLRGNIGSGVHKAFEALIDGANLDDINLGPINPATGLREGGRTDPAVGLEPISRSATVTTDPRVQPLLASLHGRIDVNGNVS